LESARAETWIDGYTGRTSGGLRQSTRDSYRDAIERVIVPYFKRTAPNLKLDEITPSMLKAFIASLAEQGKSPATVRRYYAPLRAMLASAFEDGLITRNPASGVRVIVKDDRPVKRQRMTADETKRLLAEIPAEHGDMSYLMASTGLRISEAFALEWADFANEDGEGVPFAVALRGGGPVISELSRA